MQPDLYGAIFMLVLAGIGLAFWLAPDRQIGAGTGRRKQNGMILCLVGILFALLCLLGVPIGRPGQGS